MNRELAQIVCCPVHKSKLDLVVKSEDDQGAVMEGHLHCAECPFDFPIEEGIPNLLPPEYHVDQVKDAAEA